MSSLGNKCFHIVMYPWFAIGHISSFLKLANKLAERGHKISFILPTKASLKLAPSNQHPHLINFIPIVVPHVEGLPQGVETTNDIDASGLAMIPLLMAAMDMTQDTIDAHLARLKPDFVFFDHNLWVPSLARKHGAKSVYYTVFYVMVFAYTNPKIRNVLPSNYVDLTSAPQGFPSSDIKLKAYEARFLSTLFKLQSGGMTFVERLDKAMSESDAIAANSCREIEGAYCDFFEKRFGKPLILAGPTFPKPSSDRLDDQFDEWLNGFSHGSVVYCAFGSECVLDIQKFQELVLGLELSGRPFLAALKPPIGCKTIESALPEEFEKRTKGRGIVYGGWVQQQLILQHPSVGCFVTHCGAVSLSEAMVSKCQLVLMPQRVEQFLNARLMTLELKVGIEVKKNDSDGSYTKKDVNEAISTVMDAQSEVAKEIKINHTKWRKYFSTESLEESYVSSFIQSLENLLA